MVEKARGWILELGKRLFCKEGGARGGSREAARSDNSSDSDENRNPRHCKKMYKDAVSPVGVVAKEVRATNVDGINLPPSKKKKEASFYGIKGVAFNSSYKRMHPSGSSKRQCKSTPMYSEEEMQEAWEGLTTGGGRLGGVPFEGLEEEGSDRCCVEPVVEEEEI